MITLPSRVHHLIAASLLITGTLSSGGLVLGNGSVEEAAYEVVEKDNDFEVRDYAAFMAAQTRVVGNHREAGNKAFRKLFGYISGDNEVQAKIAMTTPVISEADSDTDNGQKIAMTAPVISQTDGDTWVYQFVLPSEYDTSSAPSPTNPDVTLAVVPQKLVATVRYSGWTTDKARAEQTQLLKDWIAAKGLTAISEPRWAGYNSPRTVPSLRRNEVLIEISRK